MHRAYRLDRSLPEVFTKAVLIPFVLFLVLAIWGLIDGELYAKEASIWGAIWLICLGGMFLLRGYGLYFVAPVCLVDIVLLIKKVGNPNAF